jgi:copper homeostasis protein
LGVTLEVIALTVEDALAAEAGGADRLELVCALTEGGLTPSYGMMEAICRAVRIPAYVMIRPRGGGFVYTPTEVDVMVRDAAVARELGASGVVVGALTPEGDIDVEDLPEEIRDFDRPEVPPAEIMTSADISPTGVQFVTLRELEQRYIHEVLSATGNNKTQAAKILGINSTSLMRRLKKEDGEE